MLFVKYIKTARKTINTISILVGVPNPTAPTDCDKATNPPLCVGALADIILDPNELAAIPVGLNPADDINCRRHT